MEISFDPSWVDKEAYFFTLHIRMSLEKLSNLLEDELVKLKAKYGSDRFDVYYLTELKDFIDHTYYLHNIVPRDYLSMLNSRILEYLESKFDDTNLKSYFTPYISAEQMFAFTSLSTPYLEDLTNEIKSTIIKDLSVSALKGDTLYEIQSYLKDELKGFKGRFKKVETRAKVIARNEIGKAFSQASWLLIQELAKTIPNLKKVWHSNTDERTRPNHLEAEGQTVDWDEPFLVGGEKLMYPGDPSGSPENVINCRCWMSVEIPDEVIEEHGLDVSEYYKKNPPTTKTSMPIEEINKTVAKNIRTFKQKIKDYDFKNVKELDKKIEKILEFFYAKKFISSFKISTDTGSKFYPHNTTINIDPKQIRSIANEYSEQLKSDPRIVYFIMGHEFMHTIIGSPTKELDKELRNLTAELVLNMREDQYKLRKMFKEMPVNEKQNIVDNYKREQPDIFVRALFESSLDPDLENKFNSSHPLPYLKQKGLGDFKYLGSEETLGDMFGILVSDVPALGLYEKYFSNSLKTVKKIYNYVMNVKIEEEQKQ